MSDHYSTVPGNETTRSLTDIQGVGPKKAKYLRDAGYTTVEDVRRASQAELANVNGIGMALAARIKADVGYKNDP